MHLLVTQPSELEMESFPGTGGSYTTFRSLILSLLHV